MKKSLLAFVIASLFVVTACDNKTNSKLREAEKKIVQLEMENKKLQAELSKSPAFPALQVELVDFFEKSETLNTNHEPEVSIQVSISRAKTGVEWLDLLLLKEMVLCFRTDEEDLYPFTEKRAEDFFNDLFEENKYFAKRENITLFDDVRVYYIGQRNNIATFKLQVFGYGGGASTSTYEMYVNVDINKQAVIRREDLVTKSHEEQLWALLDKYYAKQNGDESDLKLSGGYYRQEKYSFYFTEYDVNFVFSSQIEVQVPYDELKAIMNKDYYPKERGR